MSLGAPSAWVQRWSHLLDPHASVLDVACGGGRHLAWFAARGHPVCGVDIDTTAAAENVTQAELIQADIESAPWPLSHRQFGAVVVCNYLWRPLLPQIVAAVAPGGTLIYETFADGQQSIGRPARADFLLQPGELLQVCAGLRVIGFEDGFESGAGHSGGNPRYVQRIAAVRPQGDVFPRHALD